MSLLPAEFTLDAFDGHDPNGTWTFFIADVSAGGGQSQLGSWELDITAIPEPGAWMLALGLISLGVAGGRRFKESPGIVAVPPGP